MPPLPIADEGLATLEIIIAIGDCRIMAEGQQRIIAGIAVILMFGHRLAGPPADEIGEMRIDHLALAQADQLGDHNAIGPDRPAQFAHIPMIEREGVARMPWQALIALGRTMRCRPLFQQGAELPAERRIERLVKAVDERTSRVDLLHAAPNPPNARSLPVQRPP